MLYISCLKETFKGAEAYNQPMDNWNTNKVINFSFMFNDCKSFNQPLNDWDVSNALEMKGMFAGAVNFCQSLNNWNLAYDINLTDIFDNCIALNQIFSLQEIILSNEWNSYWYRSKPIKNANMTSQIYK